MNVKIETSIIKKLKTLENFEGLPKEDLQEAVEEIVNELLEDYVSNQILENEDFYSNEDSDN